MTTEQRLTALEDSVTSNSRRLSQLEEKLQLLEREDLESTIATAVLQTLKEDVLIAQIVERTVAAVEAEWSGKFLPELRRSLREDQAASGSQ